MNQVMNFSVIILLQLVEAMNIINECKLNDNALYDLEDIKPIAEYIKKNIAVVDRERLNQIIYKTTLPYEKTIYLLYHNNHYDLITSMTAYLGYSYYCEKCDKGYNNKDGHKCETEANEETKINIAKKLNKRKRKVNNQEKIKNNGKYNKCTHKRHCVNCGVEVVGNINNHICYMQKVELKKPSTNYIISDFETRTDENYKHIVNCAHTAYYSENEKIHTITHKNITEYYNFLIDKKHKGYTVIFHNGGGYDFNFIMQELIKNGQMPEIIFTGNNVKLMVLKSLNMKFVDSYLIFGTALKNLPAMFGFDAKKGDFPHKFNNPENYDYIGPMPD